MTAASIARFDAPFDWDEIDATIHRDGGVVARGFVGPELLGRLNDEIDARLESDASFGVPTSGSEVYDTFLGHRTVRCHGLMAKFPSTIELMDDDVLNDWVDRMLGAMGSSQLMNAAELIQIGPGEPAQFLHRDSDSWPHLPPGDDPFIVNAIVALTPFSTDNGGTNIIAGSHRWPADRRGRLDDAAQVEMDAGDALLFRGDMLHGGGPNGTEDEHRRALSLSYCVGWLRTVENSFLNLPAELVATLSPRMQRLLGYAPHDAIDAGGGLIGLYENGDPADYLSDRSAD